MIKFSLSGLQEILESYGESELAKQAAAIDQPTVEQIGDAAMDLSIEGMTIEKALLNAATQVLAGRAPRRKRRAKTKE